MLLWHRLAAVAPIRPLAWELPYAMGAALKRKKKKRIAGLRTLRDEQRVHSTTEPRNGVGKAYKVRVEQ